jgi:hypothetical protein
LPAERFLLARLLFGPRLLAPFRTMRYTKPIHCRHSTRASELIIALAGAAADAFQKQQLVQIKLNSC